MGRVIEIIFAVVVVSFFVWLMRGASGAPSRGGVIDPSDARQIGTLMGLMGGSVADAVSIRARSRHTWLTLSRAIRERSCKTGIIQALD